MSALACRLGALVNNKSKSIARGSEVLCGAPQQWWAEHRSLQRLPVADESRLNRIGSQTKGNLDSTDRSHTARELAVR